MPGYVYRGSVLPLDCRGRYGRGGAAWHLRQGTPVCEACKESRNHARRRAKAGLPPLTGPDYAMKESLRAPCGTVAAYRRHLRLGEIACDPCVAANTQDMRERRREAARRRARSKALRHYHRNREAINARKRAKRLQQKTVDTLVF